MFDSSEKSLVGCHYASDEALSVAAEDGEQLVWGGNTCSCSKVEEDCWQRLRLHWKITVLWAVLSSSVQFYHVQLVNRIKKKKIGSITSWPPLVDTSDFEQMLILFLNVAIPWLAQQLHLQEWLHNRELHVQQFCYAFGFRAFNFYINYVLKLLSLAVC
jgi:hypothetical protein